MTAQAQTNWRDLLPRHVYNPREGGGPVHGDMTGRDWGGNPVSGLSVHGGKWGSFIGNGGPRPMNMIDSDSDGTDDRDQLAPWQRNTVAQTQSIPVIPYEENKGKNFLGGFVDKLKEIWNRPIMAPPITKDQHDQMIQGTGAWDSRY